MAFVFKKINPKRRKLRIAKSERSQQILDALSDYIEGGYEEPMKWLVSTWKEQANVFTYPDLYSVVTDEEFPQAVFDSWFKSYSDWVTGKMTDSWKDAMENGWKNNPVFSGMQGFAFDSSESRVRSWIQNHGAELVTNCLQEQKSAIQYLVAEAQANGTSSAELGRYIRPTIGLTRPQAAANLKHYEAVKAQLHKDHPRMSEESIEQKARASAARYAAKQQRYRAETIARTELAYAYNKGNDEAVRQAMEQRKLPIMRKVWTTAQDGHVCPMCEDLEDTEIGMNESFKATRGVRVKREVTCSEPPLHPRCKCAIAYEETGEYMTVPSDSSTEEYSEEYAETSVDNPQEDDTMSIRGMPNGLRRSPFYILNDDEIAGVSSDAEAIGVPLDLLKFNEGDRTGYNEKTGFIDIRGNVLPDTSSTSTRDIMTVRSVLAHEYYGHYMTRGTTLPPGDWRDEFRASYRAATIAPNLSDAERQSLMRDALDRANEAGVPITPNSTIRRILYGFE